MRLACYCAVFVAAGCWAQGPAPSLLPAGYRGVEIYSEVSNLGDQITYVVRERFDSKHNTYTVDFADQEAKIKETLLVNRKTGRAFLTDIDHCTGFNVSDSAKIYSRIPFLKWVRMNNMPDEGYPGPAWYLESAMNNNLSITAQGGDETCGEDGTTRGIPCVSASMEFNAQTCKFRFSAEGHKMYGRNESLPLTAIIDGTRIEVLEIKLYDKNSDMGLFVPAGLSCQIPDEFNDFGNYSNPYEFEAEVVFSSADSSSTYVSQLSGLVTSIFWSEAKLPDLYSFAYSTWKAKENTTDDLEGWYKERVIFDLAKDMYYQMRTDKDSRQKGSLEVECVKQHSSQGVAPYLVLPKFGQIDLRSIFYLRNDQKANAVVSSLGPNRVRGIDAEVNEVTYKDYYMGSMTLDRLVVTYYADDLYSPLMIEMRGFKNGSLLFTNTINFAMYTLNPIDLHLKLNVEKCYDNWGKTSAHWFQVGFEVEDRDQTANVSQSSHLIRETFLQEMYVRFQLSPMRLPQVFVDIAGEQIRVNALMLEIINIEEQFDSLYGKDALTARPIGIMTKSECLAKCLAMRKLDCTAASYCGSNCFVTTAESPLSGRNIRDDISCSISARKANITQKTVDETVKNLKEAIYNVDENKQLTLPVMISDEDDMAVLRANDFDDTADYESAFHYQKGRQAVLETSFKLIEARRSLRTSDTSKLIGSFAMDDCAVACKNRDNCESFSYCQSNRECVLSTIHDVQKDATQFNENCAIYQTKYTNRFDKFPGLTIKTSQPNELKLNADSCAQSCLSKEDCKSFEYCEKEGNCFILDTHMIDLGEGAKKSEDVSCSHYSKKYIFDYSMKPQAKGIDLENVLSEFTNITKADCAKRCTEWGAVDKVCLSFDFCDELVDNTGRCTLRTNEGEGKSESTKTCNFFYLTKPKPLAIELHGAGAAFGLSLLMLVVGAILSAGALYGYTKYRGG